MNRLFRIGFLLCLAGWLTASLLCQSAPDFGKGLTPFAVYNSTAIDNVNMTNGNVYVHIPLLSYPQRGKDLDLSFSIMANARVWGCGVPVGAGINSSGTCVWMMADETGASVAGEAAAGAYVASDQNGFVAPTYATLPNLSCSGPNGSTVPCPTPWQFWNYAYYSPGGGVHYFYSNQGGPLGSGYDTGGYPAVDGSGYTPPSSSYFDGSAVDRRGVRVGGTFQNDTDGNELTVANVTSAGGPTAYIDTLGRTIPDPESGTVSTSTSHCPASAKASSAMSWTVPGPSTANGGEETYYFCYLTMTNAPSAFPSGFVPPAAPQILLAALVLPDQTYYQFGYDNLYELTQIKLPTGGIVQYTFAQWLPGSTDPYGQRVIASRTTIDGVNPPATTNYTWIDPAGSYFYNIQTDPLGNDEVHTIGAAYSPTGGGVSVNDVETDSFEGCSTMTSGSLALKGSTCSGPGQLLKRVVRSYQTLSTATATELEAAGGGPTSQSQLLSEMTYIPIPPVPAQPTNFMVSGKVYTYVPPGVSFYWFSPYNGTQANLCYHCGDFNQIQSVAEYDWGNGSPGGIIKTTTTQYKWQDPTPSANSTVGAQYLAAGLIDLPMYVLVAGPTNLEETDYYYDEGSPVASGVTTQISSTYASPKRGHLTSVQKTINNGGSSGLLPKDPEAATTTTVWYDSGVPYQSIDAMGNTTTYSYGTFYGGAYVTSTTDALGNSVSATYDYNTGLMTSFTGINSAKTTYTYDALHRPTNISYPDGAQHTNTYNVNLPAGQGNVVVQDSIDSSRFDVHTLIYDGFGREIHTQHNSDASGMTSVDTHYDQNGHVWEVSNPYRSPSTPIFTATYYDALGRETSSVLPDGSATTTAYSAMPYTVPSLGSMWGTSKTYTDPKGLVTTWVSNARGLLGETLENANVANGMPTLTTTYLYDSLGNLSNVSQQGSGNASSAYRNRSFGYDFMSRLVYSSNPETGPIRYTYDFNSNLISKTDARGIVTTYKYDALNRVTQKTYNTAAAGATTGDLAHTPYSCYQYGTVAGNSLERLTLQWAEPPSSTPCNTPSNALTSRAFTGYDSRGRILNEQQCLGSVCSKNVPENNTYSYDLAGHLLNFGNLIGTALFSNSYDSGGKLSSVTENWSGNVGPEFPSNLFSGGLYTPHGALAAATYGTNLSISRIYDSRLRIVGESDLGTTVQKPATSGSGTVIIAGGVQTK